MATVLLAGATGTVGRHIAAILAVRGHRVRALARPGVRLDALPVSERIGADIAESGSIQGVCEGADFVISCIGASMSLTAVRDRRTFDSVDYRGNVHLLREAEHASTSRFIYLSLFGAERNWTSEYPRAHRAFEEELQRSSLPHAIVRPTGYFAFMSELVRMARRGVAVVVGDGSGRTNPVHEADVAEACVAAMEGPAALIELGGPDVMSRRELAELAADVAARRVRTLTVPPAVVRAAAAPMAVVNPRIHALVEFGVDVAEVDLVAPRVGTRDIRSYFAALAGGRGADWT